MGDSSGCEKNPYRIECGHPRSGIDRSSARLVPRRSKSLRHLLRLNASWSRISEWCRWLSRSYAQSSNQLGSFFESTFGYYWTEGCITDVSDLFNLTLSINCQRYSRIHFRPFIDISVNWNPTKQSSTSNPWWSILWTFFYLHINVIYSVV